jgi:RNA polymerase primary sigma factor
LARKAIQWDVAAINKLTKHNLRFVVSVAKQYQNQGLSLSDLINEGNLWLIKAAGRFDESRGFKFISYAVWRIRQAILIALAESSRMVRLPLNKVSLTNKINKAYTELEQDLEREPTPEEIAELLEKDVWDIQKTLAYSSKNYVSLDKGIWEGEVDATYIDLFEQTTEKPTDHEMITTSCSHDILTVLSNLKDKPREVIALYYWLDEWENSFYAGNLEAIAKRMWLTRERVRQIKDKTIEVLKNRPSTKALLKKHLG